MTDINLKTKLLDTINSPADLKQLSIEQFKQLAEEIRRYITYVVSKTGGHLASNLGTVEIILAMHRVFDFKTDKLLWDVGHQCYAHKIITGRRQIFEKLRQRDGISGFPNPQESPYDQFTVGHAGTAIATALGMALAAQKRGSNEKIAVLVGDASIVNGLSFEALNNMQLVKRQLLIVLNDNSMAIDVSQGAIAKFLSRVRLSHTYEDMVKTTNRILDAMPVIGKPVEDAIENLKRTLRMSITPSRLFESMNIAYFGPVDGHDVGSLIQLFEGISHLDTPVVLHCYTKKGKGFEPADDNPSKFHSTGPFEINGEGIEPQICARTFTDAFGDAIVGLAGENDKIIAITAAMADGTGLMKFRQNFPERFYDVGIAESVAVDLAAGQAKMGFKPVVCIYSTFLQRCFDQIFQEVALQNLPVVFCIDRAGLVGSDGPTHHGLMDIGFIRMLPNIVLVAPACEVEMKAALRFAVECGQSVAIRYPKDVVADDKLPPETLSVLSKPFETGKSVLVRDKNSDITIITYGAVLMEAIKAAAELEKAGINVDIINARFAKPFDEALLSRAAKGKFVITVEDHCLACGFGSAYLEAVNRAGICDAKIKTLAGADRFIAPDTRTKQLDEIGISAEQIVKIVKELFRF